MINPVRAKALDQSATLGQVHCCGSPQVLGSTLISNVGGAPITTNTIIALIAASASVIGAVISLLATLIKSRNERRTQQEAETLRYERDNISERRRKLDEDRKNFLDLLSREIAILQRARDLLQKILNAPKEALTVKETRRLFEEITVKAFSEYEQATGVAKQSSTELIHLAKNEIYSLDTAIEVAFHNRTYTSEITDRDRNYLRMAREALGEIQSKLRDERSQLLSEYIGHGK